MAQNAAQKSSFRPAELASKFSCKADLVKYLTEHRKLNIQLNKSMSSPVPPRGSYDVDQRPPATGYGGRKGFLETQYSQNYRGATVWRAFGEKSHANSPYKLIVHALYAR